MHADAERGQHMQAGSCATAVVLVIALEARVGLAATERPEQIASKTIASMRMADGKRVDDDRLAIL